jgi:hypothetical protein
MFPRLIDNPKGLIQCESHPPNFLVDGKLVHIEDGVTVGAVPGDEELDHIGSHLPEEVGVEGSLLQETLYLQTFLLGLLGSPGGTTTGSLDLE